MRTMLSALLGLGPKSGRLARRDLADSPPVLIASGKQEDQRTIQDLFRGSRWRAVPVTGWRDALDLITGASIPVVLCDRDLPGPEWQQGITALHRSGACPAVILLSGVADPYLWDELVQAGGFDVLTRPFRRDETLAMIEFAYTHWKTERQGQGAQLITPFRTA